MITMEKAEDCKQKRKNHNCISVVMWQVGKERKKRVLCVATLWFTQERTGTSGILSRSHDHLNLGFLFVLQMWMSAFVLNILLIDFDFVSFDILIMMVRTRWLLARVKLYCVGHQLLVALWPRLSSTFN
jgi:hypothetical protein